MLLEVFKEHNQKCSELIGKDYVRATVMYYERTARPLSEFIKQNHRISAIPLKDTDYPFIPSFDNFPPTAKNCQQPATAPNLKNPKRIHRPALINHWIITDTFAEIHFKQTPTNRDFLLEEELQLILRKQFNIPRLETVKDIVIFCCFIKISKILW